MAKQSGISQTPLVNRIPTGYDGAAIPTEFSIPSCGIEDVDTSLFNLFDRDSFIQITINDEEGNTGYKHKVPVVFATGERYALTQRNKPIRDKSGGLILPIISITRTSLNQQKDFMGGYGLGQNPGDIVVKKQLSSKDRNWQNIINKLSIQNQDSVASIANFISETLQTGNKPGRLASRRDKFTKKTDKYLKSNLNNNIFEIYTLPFPVFYHAVYEITIWTSFRQHMNEIVEKIMTNYDGQGRTYKLTTDKGYWFMAYFEDDIGSDDNVEDFTDQLRAHKTTFTVKVPAYMFANQNGGDMIPIRRYLSAPQLSFDVFDGIFEQPFVSSAPSADKDKFILSDIDNPNQAGVPESGRDEKFYQRKVIKDPFSGEEEEVFLEVKYRGARSGETTISKRKLFGIDIP